jgi:hypothetical protein
MTTAEYPLPAQRNKGAARKADGFATPKQDKKPQCARILPKRVLPVIFLPGIMGSNLRMSAQRKQELDSDDNIAWRPDSLGTANIKANANRPARERQLRLDPLQRTSVAISDMQTSSSKMVLSRHCWLMTRRPQKNLVRLFKKRGRAGGGRSILRAMVHFYSI